MKIMDVILRIHTTNKYLSMKTTKSVKLVLVTLAIAGSTVAFANENGENLFYLGAGSASKSESYKSNATPLAIGYLRFSNINDNIFGFDIAGEGTMLDSTGGQYNAVKQAVSYNLLVGRNVSKNENYRFDAALLIGMRETTSSCPSSYLGYQCYADSAPDTQHGVNFGGVLTWTYKSFMLGVRATGESKQVIAGFRF